MKELITFEKQVDELILTFPKLRKAVTEENVTIVRGQLEVIDRDGKHWETYQVEIHPRDGFPYCFPLVFETGGKIPRISDWHVYEDTESCCIAVEPEEHLICKDGLSLTTFVKNHVLPYFFNQTFWKVEGYYKNGEYAHGKRGIYQFYDEALNTKGDVKETIRLLVAIAETKKPGRTHRCFCGSKQKFRKCHREGYEKLSGLGKEMLYRHANEFLKAAQA